MNLCSNSTLPYTSNHYHCLLRYIIPQTPNRSSDTPLPYQLIGALLPTASWGGCPELQMSNVNQQIVCTNMFYLYNLQYLNMMIYANKITTITTI